MAIAVAAQEKPVSITGEAHHQLVLENEYTRVFHVVVPSKQSTLVHQHDLDYVSVQIGASDITNEKAGAAAAEVKLDDGAVKFAKGGFAHKISILSDTPFENLTIEVKKASTKSICAAAWPGVQPEKGRECTLIVESGLVGQETNVETDAVEARTYFTTGSGTGLTLHADSPSLLVPLTELRCACGGSPEKEMKRGDATWLPKGTSADVTKVGSKSNAVLVMVTFK